MKKNVIAIGGLCLLFTVCSCSKKGTVSFCEGVDADGKGVNCGTVFTTGDLTAVFNAKDSFGTDSLEVKIFNTQDGGRKPFLERAVSVNPDSTEGKADLDLYDEGTFSVTVRKHSGDIVSQGQVEIIDSYTKPQ
ncbi:MAG: hypothetical protein ACRCUT_12345 [Spirochaetota bacterium]